MEKEKSKYYKYQGAIHIHTIHSDGTKDVEYISKAARKAGLSWIVITDHNTFEAQEGYINGVCVIKALEISPKHENHYLAFDTNKIYDKDKDIKDIVQEVREDNGFGFAAHPDENINRKNKYKIIKWTDKNVIPDGIELWNWFSQWGDSFDDTNILTVIYSYLFRSRLVKKPYKETINWWDELNRKTFDVVPAIGGIDAHALKVSKYFIPVTIFPYEFMFQKIANEIFLKEELNKDFNIAKKQIVNAIKSGNNIIFKKDISSDVPEIFMENNSNVASCAEKIKLDSNTFLKIKYKNDICIRIYKDGEQIAQKKSKDFLYKISQEGKYRVEADVGGMGFIYSNPIVVLKG